MFFFVLIALVAALHLYLWKRLIADTTLPRTRARRVATVVLLVLVALMVAALTLGTTISPAIAQWFAWPGYLWLALFFYLLLGLLVLELPRLALRGWVRRDPARAAPPSETEPDTPDDDQPRQVSRRIVLARGSAALAGAAAAGLTGYGVTVALGAPTITQVALPVRRLDPRAAGCRVALISDVHLGPILGRPFTERIVEMVNAQRPDVVAIAGDLTDGSVDDLAEATAPLARLRSTHGTFFVTGNHEYYRGYEQWVEYLPTLGIRVLRNERDEIQHNGGLFDLAGINDATGYQWQDAGDVGRAVAGRDPSRAVVLLAHQPVDATEAAEHGVDLMLAGHTHGGQLSPFELIVNAQQGAVSGRYQVGDMTMYVTRGAGFWGPPVRVGAPPDITMVELHPA